MIEQGPKIVLLDVFVIDEDYVLFPSPIRTDQCCSGMFRDGLNLLTLSSYAPASLNVHSTFSFFACVLYAKKQIRCHLVACFVPLVVPFKTQLTSRHSLQQTPLSHSIISRSKFLSPSNSALSISHFPNLSPKQKAFFPSDQKSRSCGLFHL
jgi:hypothetical protein